eukprot:3718878-Pyramimonas_sp.AAC.1
MRNQPRRRNGWSLEPETPAAPRSRRGSTLASAHTQANIGCTPHPSSKPSSAFWRGAQHPPSPLHLHRKKPPHVSRGNALLLRAREKELRR